MKITNGIMKYLFNTINQPAFIDGANGPTGYAIYRNLRILQDEIKDYDKVIDDALKEFGQESEDGRFYIDENDTDAIKKFEEKVNPISNLEVDVNLYQIPKEEFVMPYCPSATPAQYALIEETFVLPEKEEVTEVEKETEKEKEE
mgnify:FL=1